MQLKFVWQVLPASLLFYCLSSFNMHKTENFPSHTIAYDDSTINGGLTLPVGFTATVVSNTLPAVRHMAVTKSGGLYVKLAKLKNGKGIYFLQDGDGDGKYEMETGFGNFTGTGMYIKNGYLYASSDEEVFRYKLDEQQHVLQPDQPQRIVTGLVNRRRDASKTIVLDEQSNLYVTVGSYINACEVPGTTKGMKPCPLLDSVAGIWQFKSDRSDQQYSDGDRFATGLKNVVAATWNPSTNSLFVMQHGRDQLPNPELPAECMYQLHKGDDAGWPYLYYDHFLHKKMLSPEYGGNGKIQATNKAIEPVVAFPAHLAPNGLLFYTGNMFPSRYRNGAFIAFHGKSPELNKGFLVAFQPFKNGKPFGKWEVFADNFAGVQKTPNPGPVQHRPCGLAMGPDGALYVSDDTKGFIYRISYNKK